MKKKGLIISTVVMVVVLIASLTTATYAWFTTTASAKIDELQVQTQSSKGLEIAIFTPGNSNTFTSGNATLGSYAWTGENANWGSSVSFDNADVEYMGVSGNGKTMYKLKDDKAAFGGGDTVLGTAELEQVTNPNEHYFMAYVAIKNTETSNAKALEITSLNITATANANGLTGMAASLRIAIFGVKGTQAAGQEPNTNPYDQAPADFTASDPIAVYAPFNNIKYSGGSWTAQTNTDENTYISGTGSDSQYSNKKSGTFTTFKSIDQEGGAAAPGTVTGTNLKLGSDKIDENDIFYMMIVIWFEGEDAQCSNYFAGGGATISFTFGKVAD